MTKDDAVPVTAELLPCPFCGGEARSDGHIRYSKPLADTWWEGGLPITEAFYVNCIKCGAVTRSGLVGGYQTKTEAIERWNARHRGSTAVVDAQKIADCIAAAIEFGENGLTVNVEQATHAIVASLSQTPATPMDDVGERE